MKKTILLVAFIIPFVLFSQGKLERAKEGLASKKNTENSSSSDLGSSRIDNHRNEALNETFTTFFAEIGYYVFWGTFIGNSEYRSITPYPYFKNLQGEYVKVYFEGSKNQLFKLGMNQMFDKEVKGLELKANYRVIPILGVEVSHLGFSESSINGKQYLDISSVMVNYYRIREQRISLWWGLGATYVGNSVNTFGFAYNFGSEIYPFKPVSFDITYKQSFVNTTSVNEFHWHIKYHIQKMALFTGFHANTLDSEQVKGLVFGAEYTF